MAKASILVTGGAGYIGSHVVRQLGEAGEKVVILDNLGRGFRQAVTAGELVVGDVGDQALVSRLLAEHRIDTVMHFAAHTIVPESVAFPLKYYGNNTCSSRAGGCPLGMRSIGGSGVSYNAAGFQTGYFAVIGDQSGLPRPHQIVRFRDRLVFLDDFAQ